MILKRASSKERNGAEYFYKDFDTESRSTEVASVRIKDCLLESDYSSVAMADKAPQSGKEGNWNFHASSPQLA